MPHSDPEVRKAYLIEYRKENQANERERYRRNKELNKQKIRSAKEVPCADCGVQYGYWMMQFDHVSGEKLGNISTFVSNRQFTKAWEEIAKCEVVCANCHANRTYQRQPKGSDDPRWVS